VILGQKGWKPLTLLFLSRLLKEQRPLTFGPVEEEREEEEEGELQQGFQKH
jgi:hypothetical protein